MDEHAHSGENENFGRKTADARSHFPCRFCILTFPPHLARPRNARPFLEGAARPPKRGLINRRVILSTDRSRSSVNCSSCWPPGKKKNKGVAWFSRPSARPGAPATQDQRERVHALRSSPVTAFFFFFLRGTSYRHSRLAWLGDNNSGFYFSPANRSHADAPN